MDIKTIEKITEGLSQDDMKKLLAAATKRNPKAEISMLEALEQTGLSPAKELVAEKLLQSCWKSAKKIIAYENKYGYAEPQDEEVAFLQLNNIKKLVEKYNFSAKVRKKVLDEMAVQHNLDNSIFISELEEIMYSMCQNDEERSSYNWSLWLLREKSRELEQSQ